MQKLMRTEAVVDPYRLKAALVDVKQSLAQLTTMSEGPSEDMQGMILRKLVSKLITNPKLTVAFAIPYAQQTAQAKADDMIEFLDDKAEEFQLTMNPIQTANKESMAVQRQSHLTRDNICIHYREDGTCKLQNKGCPGKHIRTGKVCTNKYMPKYGLCSMYHTCTDKHPYDESVWKISRKDSLRLHWDEMTADP